MNFLNRTFLVWITCLILMIVVSLFTVPPPSEVVDKIVWSKSFLRLPLSERARNSGLRSPLLWWSALVCLALALYAYMIWFQFWGPLVKHS